METKIKLTDKQKYLLPHWAKCGYGYTLSTWDDIKGEDDKCVFGQTGQPVIIENCWSTLVIYGNHCVYRQYHEATSAEDAASQLARECDCGDSHGLANVRAFKRVAMWSLADSQWQTVDFWVKHVLLDSNANHHWLIAEACIDRRLPRPNNYVGCGLEQEDHEWVADDFYDMVGEVAKNVQESHCSKCGLRCVATGNKFFTGTGRDWFKYSMGYGHWCRQHQKWDCVEPLGE